MLKTKSHRKQNAEKGFTFVETLVSLLIVAMTAVILYGAFNSSIRAVHASVTHTISNYQLLKTESILRKKIGNVDIPYWEKNCTYTASNTKIEMPWYCGKSGWNLSLYVSESGVLVLETDTDTKEVYKLPCKLKNISFTAVTSSEGIPYGLRISFTKDGQPQTTTVLFRSRPLSGLSEL